MERSLEAFFPEEASRGIFSRKGAIFGGGNKTPTSTRPSTSSGSRRTANTSQSSTGSNDTTASSASSSGLSRKPSFSRLTRSPPKPPPQARTSSFSTAFVVPNFITPDTSRPTTSSAKTANGRKASNASLQLRGDKGRGSGEVARVGAAQNRESWSSTAAYSRMITVPFSQGGDIKARSGSSAGSNGAPLSATISNTAAMPSLETISYQHIQEVASKRISTLDYLRKAHEGRVYWFNTLLFNKPDLARMPYFDSKKLARRATNYLLLGVSLPTILDLNSSNAVEFLRSLNALLAEFESYQLAHPPDGSSGSLSRARLPQMFKRAASSTNSKGRRTSSAADIGLPMGSENDPKSIAGGMSTTGIVAASFPASENDLLPGEEYSLLLTPSLPFEPDFYETFATLCDVLIDCYTRLMSLLATPKDCNTLIADMFFKADGRVRKIIVQGVVKEFEDSCRSGAKSEVASVGKVVLGGLM
ncbi:hypothetical protein V490_08142 [Pseudogymnoascus sp. VKM F-3557]|nr:hypothetical protein V490_08142 [Pseudogymnoascus sp. VKM F-3557]